MVDAGIFTVAIENEVIFDATESIDYVVDKSSVNETKFESWMEQNQTDPFARTLLYVEIPKFYVWNQKQRIWTRTHRENKDDKEYIDGILEASLWGMGDYLRSIFVMLIMTNSMSRPEIVWEKTWMKLAEDVLNVERIKQGIPDLELSDIQTKNICLLIYDETSYNKDQLREQHVQLYGSLPTEQKGIYSTIMDAVDNNKGGMFFVYGYGGTGKTYLYKTMSVVLHSKGDIVLNVASSGIAALLLEGGRTTHSCFAIPIYVVEYSMCHIAADNDLANLIRKANLIIWDEAPMINRHCYEAFDRALRDICRTDPFVASDKVFGGKVVLFGGDFRQILLVINNGGRQDVVNATINSSYLWKKCTVLRLTVTEKLVEKKTYTWNKEGKEYSRKECGKHVRKTRRNNNNENRNKQLVCFGGNKKQNCFARLRTRGTLLVKEVERIPREEKQSRIVCEEGKR
ncbi:ATP-dependent DNA helicase PIF1-like protein [Tanacetum coccineum]|uniref:ATP-dependent DNA helicase n=1 Tax=Tanacetum coccineum TaxID=301880 RepID=A0ABQ5F089_9ASTR